MGRARAIGISSPALVVALALAALGLAAPAPAIANSTQTPAPRGSLPISQRDAALSFEVGRDPFALRLLDGRGRTVLSQSAGTGSGATGTLGFRGLAGLWSHATRVTSASRDGSTRIYELATTDPTHTIELELKRAGEGVVALDARLLGPSLGVEGMGIAFDAPAGERYLGFGERSNAVDQAGRTVEDYVADGPYQSEEYPFLTLFVPIWGLRERDDATYYPVPWLLSSRGYGALVDNPETSYFRLGSDRAGAWSAEVRKAPDGELGAELAPAPTRLRMRFFAGPKPADALRRFTRATGRQPAPAAPWTLGSWLQAPDDEAADIEAMRAADVPVSVQQSYLHYLPCGDQQGVEDAQPARTAAAHRRGTAITTYFNPMICTNYSPAYGEAQAAGALTRNILGLPYVYRYGANLDDLFFVSQFDFRTAAGRERYGSLLGEAVRDGYDGWMEDFGEYTPLDSRSGAGAQERDGSVTHNPYPRDYHCAAYEATRDAAHPIVRFQRSGWTGAAPCAQVVWGGDPTTSFGFDGLASAVRQALSAGTSGIGIWGSDIGGFFALGTNSLSPELLKRWVQFGALSPVMRTQANGVALPPRDRPQVTDPDQLANWRRYTKLHTQLYPYLRAAVAKYRRSGLPPMRALGLVYPGDAGAGAVEDELMLGADLLAAPVIEAGARERSLYLPRGRWLDLWRSARYVKRTGGLRLVHTRAFGGGRDVTLPAPLGRLPLLVRSGAVLATLSPAVDTLAHYGAKQPGITTLPERRRQLRLLAFPRGRSSSGFSKRGRAISREHRGSWTLRLRGVGERHYRLQAALANLRHPFRPCALTRDGRKLDRKRWSYDRASGILRARFTGRGGETVLHVRGGCG